MQISSANIQLNSSHFKDVRRESREYLALGENTAGMPWSPETLSNGVVYERTQFKLNASYSQQLRQSVRVLQNQTLQDSDSQIDPEIDLLSQLKSRVLNLGGELAEGPTESTVAGSGPSSADLQKLVAVTEAQTGSSNTTQQPVNLENLDADTYLLKLLVESFTGSQIERSHVNLSAPTAIDVEALTPAPITPSQSMVNNNAVAPTPEPAFGLLYQYEESYQETETTHFQGSGQLMTSDGRTISLDLSQTMHREFIQESNVRIAIGAAQLMDPLIVNFGPDQIELSSAHYSFDLNADGSAEQIAFTQGNSGFLSLDKNGNGRIDDGTELFGALSGNGFQDLAAYDEDANGFIDEGDSVFARLTLLQKDTAGNDVITSLADKGVGALYLGHQDTPFELKNAANELQGVVRATGLFVLEDGEVGTLQQIDLVV